MIGLRTGALSQSRFPSRRQLEQCREHGRLYAQSQQWALEYEHEHWVPLTQKSFARIPVPLGTGPCVISGRASPPRQRGKAWRISLSAPPPTAGTPAGLSGGRWFYVFRF